MNLVGVGQQNIILNGNPTKTFFKSSYCQYTNFGLQRFRLDYEGNKTLQLTEESTFTFKVRRYADLLMDTYISVKLPNIWSPIMPPQEGNNYQWSPYEFKWIENIGSKIISKIQIICGNYTLQEYSGNYLLASVQRDFNNTKKNLFDAMTGSVLYNTEPATYGRRENNYPNAYYVDPTINSLGPEPSIRETTLYIPLNNWFGLKSQMAFPLISLQYNELQIIINFRPINQLFRIRDVFDYQNNFPYISPNFNIWYQQFYRFLQPPPDRELSITSYLDTRTLWNTDIHLLCTYCFLSNEEQRVFALQEQKYIFKQVNEQIFYNVTGSNKVELNSLGLITSWLFYFQRSDVNLRNEWSNYTNYPYNYQPYDITIPTIYDYNYEGTMINPSINPDGSFTKNYITGYYNSENIRNILIELGILLDGSYRENILDEGVFNYIEKYIRTTGNGTDGLYCYNFCIQSDNSILQPSGAINMNRFNQIELEFTTIIPPLDEEAQSLVICDPESGTIVGINKPTWKIYNYNYDLYLFEERINVINFISGNVGLMYAT